MAKSGAFIRDLNLLEELGNRLKCTGEAMANIDSAVISHINGTRDTLKQKLDFIQDRLRDAQQRLSMAEAALSACRASQASASASGMMCPSCIMEEQDVEMARMEVEKWRMREEQGQQIVQQCQSEIEAYNGSGGGHYLIQNMCNQQTPKAYQLLRGCIEKLQDVLSTDLKSGNIETVATVKTDCRPSTDDKRFEAFRKSIRKA